MGVPKEKVNCGEAKVDDLEIDGFELNRSAVQEAKFVKPTQLGWLGLAWQTL